MSLSRLWRQQGKRQEARDLLAEVYAWFTEGFDTADIQEAQALLDELAQISVPVPSKKLSDTTKLRSAD
jgi:predicted ATPase